MSGLSRSSGCYGRLTTDDAAEDAVLMSRAVGKPVRVQWMRADEHVWEPKGPQQLMMVRGAIDDQGKITAWDFKGRTFPWTEAQGTPQLGERQIGQKNTAPYPGSPTGAGAVAQLYDIPNQKVGASYVPWPQDDPTPLRTNPLRSPGEPAGWFASESFVDEIAAALGVDAFQFRVRQLTGNQRAAGSCCSSTVQQAGWKERPSPSPASGQPKAAGRGVALIARGNTLVAAVAEVEVDRSTGNVAVKRITVGHDCGLIINPDGLKFQIEANAIQGVSRAVMEEVKFDETGVKSVDWRSYPVITFRNVPEVDIVLKKSASESILRRRRAWNCSHVRRDRKRDLRRRRGASARGTFHPGASPECDKGQRRNLPARINRFATRPRGSARSRCSRYSNLTVILSVEVRSSPFDLKVYLKVYLKGARSYFVTLAPASLATAASVVCAAFKPRRKSLSE